MVYFQIVWTITPRNPCDVALALLTIQFLLRQVSSRYMLESKIPWGSAVGARLFGNIVDNHCFSKTQHFWSTNLLFPRSEIFF